MKRIDYLDGHRGVAILLVVFYHAYYRWTEIVPYGDALSDVIVFQYGYFGVQLFFLISGFVILMTLEKTQTFREFVYKRWLRLFPAMLICSIIIYLTAGYFFERPSGQAELRDLIPGLSFIEPYFWHKITGLSLHSLEGTFWSLYVEFKFYIFAALVYFLFGNRTLVFVLLLSFLSWFALEQVGNTQSNAMLSILSSIANALSFKYFGWFSAGTAFFMYVQSNDKWWFYLGLIIAVFSAWAVTNLDIKAFITLTVIVLFFAISLLSKTLQKMLSHPMLLFFGFISYPLYLLHENMMIAIIIKSGKELPESVALLLPFVAIGIISLLAYLIAKFIERPVKKLLVNLLAYIPKAVSPLMSSKL